MSHDKSAIDLDGQEGDLMSGVFRWKATHRLRSLPLLPADHYADAEACSDTPSREEGTKAIELLERGIQKTGYGLQIDVTKSWSEFFTSRVSICVRLLYL